MFLNEKKSIKKVVSLFSVFILLICTMTMNLAGAAEYLETPLTLTRTLSDSLLKINQPFTVNYKIVPQTVAVAEHVQKDKEFFIVIDTSGSMDEKLEGSKRITVAKEAAKSFLNKIKGKTGVKAGLISYDNLADIDKDLTSNINSLITAVDGLHTGGGTNIGDGLRRAYYKLIKSGNPTAEKYIILLTDGEPTYHSLKKGKLMIEDGIPDDYNGGGSISTEKDINYCYTIAETLLNPSDIKSYMIAFTTGSNQNVLETVAKKAGGTYKQALTSGALNQVYDEIYEEIINDFSLQNVTFEEILPAGIEVVSVPAGFTVNGQVLTGNLPAISYKYNATTKQYSALPIEFEVTLKGNTAGSFVLGANNTSKLSYLATDGSTQVKYFAELSFKVSDLEAPLTLNRNLIGAEDLKIQQLFEINYLIKPETMEINDTIMSNNKEIVLVIDTSSSMNYDINGNYTYYPDLQRRTIAKKAAEKFIDNLKGRDDVKIALVSYNAFARVDSGLSSNFTDLKNKINALGTDYGTNIGDGLRRAYYILKNGDSKAEKYIVLLTDGEPTEYSVASGSFYLDDGNAPKTEKDYTGTMGTNYCNAVVENLVNTMSINNYFIAFSTKSNMLNGLAQLAGGQYKKALNADDLYSIYEDISTVVDSEYVVRNVKFSETFPSGLIIDNVDSKLSISGNTVNGNLGDIPYTYNNDTGKYTANEIQFKIRLKGNASGEYVLNNSKIGYVDIDGENEMKPFPELNVTIHQRDPDDPYIPDDPDGPIVDPGAAELKVTNVTRTGEEAEATVKITLPTGTIEYQIINAADSKPISVEVKNGNNIITGINIYQTLKAKLRYKNPDGSISETGEVFIYKAIDVN